MFHSPEAYSETSLCKQVKVLCFYLETLNGETKEFIILILNYQGQKSPNKEVICIMSSYLILLSVCSFFIAINFAGFFG